jgi:hypothetical protein
MTEVLTMSPFQPKGDRSMRVIVAELVANTTPGDLITYETLAEALDLDEKEQRDQIRQAVSAARQTVLRDYNKALVAIRGEGYRVALAREFAGLAQGHRQKADRQMTKALDIVKHVDENQLSPAELQRHRAVATIITTLHSRLTDAESRLQQLEAAVFGKKPPVIQGEVEPEL